MKVISLAKNQIRYVDTAFTRVSDTEAQIHHYDGNDWINSNVDFIIGSKLELDTIETFYKQMIEAHPSRHSEFITVSSSSLAVADTVMVESNHPCSICGTHHRPHCKTSGVRASSCAKTLAAQNKAPSKRFA